MKIGCFALIKPFSSLAEQFRAIRELGFSYADVTDNQNGASLGAEYGFAATASLQTHPTVLREMAVTNSITLTSVCAHANLLDPSSPARYGTVEIINAVKLAHFLGVKQVITTEGDAKTHFAASLSTREKVLIIREKLEEPVAWAEELGVELLLEPHGEVTDSIEATAMLLDALGREQTVGLNLDTGNVWLGGTDPLAYIEHFGNRIRHVHWKDMGPEWKAKRGKLHGCGMATIPLGSGVVGVERIVQALHKVDFDGPTTLEIAGEEAVKQSAENLRHWWGV